MSLARVESAQPNDRTSAQVNLPYFDVLLDGKRRGETAARAYERFVHWGYWEKPGHARTDGSELGAAMSRMNSELLKQAEIADGQQVLDVGCGFGGTIAEINSRLKRMNLVGVNIDTRQLDVARSQTHARPTNTLQWMHADACELPFPDAHFDRVLAFECIFHFSSRFTFLQQVARVLRPGGTLTLSDFVPYPLGLANTALGGLLQKRIARGYGDICGWPNGSYTDMAKQLGLEVITDRNVTANTLPTYPSILALARQTQTPADLNTMKWPTQWLRWASAARLVRYRLVTLRKLVRSSPT